MKRATCGTCRYIDPDQWDPQTGRCLESPPVYVKDRGFERPSGEVFRTSLACRRYEVNPEESQ